MTRSTPDNTTFSIPVDYNREIEPELVGMRPAAVERIAKIFEEQVTKHQLHPAAQLVVLRHGHVILDRALGRSGGVQITPNTPFLTFSMTKAFTAVCIHRLIEDGKIELDAPVAEYWPAFGCRGKESATIRHVFLHQTGIPTAGLHRLVPWWPLWDVVTSRVARLKAQHPPGTRCAYHQMNYGFILGEVFRRVSGRMIDDYLMEEFLAPMGLQRTWMRIPHCELKNSPRISCSTRGGRKAALGLNLAILRRSLLPAAGLHSSARELAIFYQMLLNQGQYAGRNFLQPETIAAATQTGYEGWDEISQSHMRWAYGFHLGQGDRGDENWGSGMGKGSTQRTFGHFGLATSMAWADPDAGLVLAFTCSRILNAAGYNARWREISDSVWDALM